jgi:uncharacterized membrane protein
MFDEVLWALVLVVLLVLIVRGLGGPRTRRPEDPLSARLGVVEEELGDLKAQLRLLVERVWFLEQGRGGPTDPPRTPEAATAVPPAAPEAEPVHAVPAGSAVPWSAPGASVGPAAPLPPPAATGGEVVPPPLARQAATPPAPPAPTRRDLEQRIGARWTTWLGVLAILFALGFFLRWALERELLGPLARVLVGVTAGVLLLTAGQRLHQRRNLPYLSEGLSGGGLGALYLSLYAAQSFYGLLGTAAAFYLMFLVTLAGAVVAVTSDRQVTAVLALLGGLLTPVLLATDRPDERVLLGYLLVLDCLALAVARYRSWPALGYVAWAGTALLVLPGLMRKPAAGQLAARLILLTVIWALFLALPMLRERTARERERELDLALVGLNAFGYFYAVYATLQWWAPAAQGPAALGLAVIYALVGERYRRRVPHETASAMTHQGVGAVLLTVGFGLALRGPWITLAWAAQGLALLAVAPLAGTLVASWGGIGALLLSAARVLWIDPEWHPPITRVWNAAFLIHLLVVAALGLAGMLAGRLGADQPPGLGRERSRDVVWLAGALVLAALLWREPQGLWPAALLSAEVAALGWLGCASRAPAFLLAAPLVAGVVVVRMFGPDALLARRGAAALVNLPLLTRIGACLAIGVAGRGLRGAKAAGAWPAVGRFLTGAAVVLLLVVLSLGWIAHQDVALAEARRAADWPAAEEVRWQTQVGLSLLWTVLAAIGLVWGLVRAVPILRYGALALLGVVIAKVFAVDLAAVHTGYRIVSFLVLGLVLLGVSYLYQRVRRPA